MHFKSDHALSSSVLAMACLEAVFDFVVSVNPLSLKHLWHHHSLTRVYISILFTSPHLSHLSPLGGICFFAYPSYTLKLFAPVCHVTFTLKFWIGRNWTSTSQCFSGSSAKWNTVGLVRDAPVLVSMVTAGLYLVQLFHCVWWSGAKCEEWGLFPWGISRKWGNVSRHRHI